MRKGAALVAVLLAALAGGAAGAPRRPAAPRTHSLPHGSWRRRRSTTCSTGGCRRRLPGYRASHGRSPPRSTRSVRPSFRPRRRRPSADSSSRLRGAQQRALIAALTAQPSWTLRAAAAAVRAALAAEKRAAAACSVTLRGSPDRGAADPGRGLRSLRPRPLDPDGRSVWVSGTGRAARSSSTARSSPASTPTVFSAATRAAAPRGIVFGPRPGPLHRRIGHQHRRQRDRQRS